mgnify:CR=1 FL=1
MNLCKECEKLKVEYVKQCPICKNCLHICSGALSTVVSKRLQELRHPDLTKLKEAWREHEYAQVLPDDGGVFSDRKVDVFNNLLQAIKEVIKMFDPNKPYQRRDGKFAKIIYTRTDGTLIVLDSDEILYSMNKDGSFSFGKETDCDLVNIPEKIEGWINMYEISYGLHQTKADADKVALHGRIACIKVSFEEGGVYDR